MLSLCKPIRARTRSCSYHAESGRLITSKDEYSWCFLRFMFIFTWALAASCTGESCQFCSLDQMWIIGYSLRPHMRGLWKHTDKGPSWILLRWKMFKSFQTVNLRNSEYWRRLSHSGTWKNMHRPSSSVWITCIAGLSSFRAFGNCFNSQKKE